MVEECRAKLCDGLEAVSSIGYTLPDMTVVPWEQRSIRALTVFLAATCSRISHYKWASEAHLHVLLVR